MKKNDIFVSIIFIVFLVAPNILFWIFEDKMDHNVYENRLLAEKPKLTVNNITKFPKEYENYFNDHLPFKNEIRKLRSNLLLNIFNISSSQNVIIGKNGWFFFTGESTLSDYTKTTIYSDDDKQKKYDLLIETQNKLKNKNIDFYIFAIPNKETVYSDKLKGVVSQNPRKYTKAEDLLNYLQKDSQFKIIYPKDVLIEARKNYDTYYKYDTHWNDYGAYLGVLELMKFFDKNFKSTNVVIDFELNRNGDLAKMNLTTNATNKEPVVNDFYDDINATCENINNYSFCSSDKPLYGENILFVGDSFRLATIKYLSKLFNNSVFVHLQDYDESLLDKYNIDIVIFEFVERYSWYTGESGRIIS